MNTSILLLCFLTFWNILSFFCLLNMVCACFGVVLLFLARKHNSNVSHCCCVRSMFWALLSDLLIFLFSHAHSIALSVNSFNNIAIFVLRKLYGRNKPLSMNCTSDACVKSQLTKGALHTKSNPFKRNKTDLNRSNFKCGIQTKRQTKVLFCQDLENKIHNSWLNIYIVVDSNWKSEWICLILRNVFVDSNCQNVIK